jgi:hypothetical protein
MTKRPPSLVSKRSPVNPNYYSKDFLIMTHPIYSQTTLEALSTAQVKDIAKSIGAIPDGDKRVKQTWVAAIIDHQKVFTPAKFKAMEAHIETVMNRWESVTPAASELPSESPTIDTYVPTPPTHADDVAFASAMGLTYDDVFGLPSEAEQESIAATADAVRNQREASIVALVAILAFSVAFLVIKTGLTSTAWVIAALIPLALGLWRYLLPDSKGGERIDYFPGAIV